MEYSKLQTLRLMLDQEKKNLEALLAEKKQQTPEITRAQANIRTLQEQLNQLCGEVTICFQLKFLNATSIVLYMTSTLYAKSMFI